MSELLAIEPAPAPLPLTLYSCTCGNRGNQYCSDRQTDTTVCGKRVCQFCKFDWDNGQVFCRDHLPKYTKLGQITVANLYHYNLDLTEGEYIGRENLAHGIGRSPLANPFSVKQCGEAAYAKFKAHLWADIKAKGEMYQELLRLRDFYLRGLEFRLLCWCAPKKCHGEIVKAAIEWLAKEARNA